MKNILIVSNNALSKKNNNGKTLNSIFSNYKDGCVSQIYFNNEVPESDILTNYFYFPGLGRSAKTNNGKAGKGGRLSIALKSFLNDKAEALKLLFRDSMYPSSYHLSDDIVQWVRQQSPSCIFFVAGNYTFSIELVLYLSAKLEIPIFTYITDDYIIENNITGFFNGIYRKKLYEKYEFLLGSSRKVYLISDYMKERFNQEFSINGEVLINCTMVDRGRVSDLLERTDNAIVVTYAGGLHLKRLESIVQVAKLFKKLELNDDVSIKVMVYTGTVVSPSTISKLSQNGIYLKSVLDWKQLEIKLLESDILLHVESFDEKVVKKTKYSLSTKIPEYLSSGKCVIAYGPDSIASIKIFSDENIGVVLTTNDKQNLKALKSVFFHESTRELIANNAMEYVMKHFHPKVLQERLYNEFREL